MYALVLVGRHCSSCWTFAWQVEVSKETDRPGSQAFLVKNLGFDLVVVFLGDMLAIFRPKRNIVKNTP